AEAPREIVPRQQQAVAARVILAFDQRVAGSAVGAHRRGVVQEMRDDAIVRHARTAAIANRGVAEGALHLLGCRDRTGRGFAAHLRRLLENCRLCEANIYPSPDRPCACSGGPIRLRSWPSFSSRPNRRHTPTPTWCATSVRFGTGFRTRSRSGT